MFARILVLAAVTVVLWAIFAHESGASGPEQAYRVRPGDTLWSIAVEHYPGDPRESVWRLRERNGLDRTGLDGTTIVPGQRLVLP